MSYGHANCQKCGEPTKVYPEVGEDESGILCKDCRIAALEAEIAGHKERIDHEVAAQDRFRAKVAALEAKIGRAHV